MSSKPGLQELHVHTPRIRILYAERKNLGRWDFQDLRAPYYRIYQQDAPGAWIDFGDGPIPLHPGVVYLIPPQTPFHSGADRDTRQFYIHFLIDHDPIRFNGDPLPLHTPLDDHLKYSMQGAWDADDPDSQALYLDAFVRTVLARMKFHFPKEELSTRMEQAQELLRSNLRTGIRNAELAKQLHMSEKAFVRWFGAEADCSPQAWLNRERIQEAALRLHHTDISIDRIAEQVGFCDRHHFSRVFKNVQGVPPGTFRRNRELIPVR